MKRRTYADGVAAGRAAERADVLAWIDRIGGANARKGERGDDASALAAHRMIALREALAVGVHEGEAAE
jgi:hypothetical protein